MKAKQIAVIAFSSLSVLAASGLDFISAQAAQTIYHRASVYHRGPVHHRLAIDHSAAYHNERHAPNPYSPGYTMGRHRGE